MLDKESSETKVNVSSCGLNHKGSLVQEVFKSNDLELATHLQKSDKTTTRREIVIVALEHCNMTITKLRNRLIRLLYRE